MAKMPLTAVKDLLLAKIPFSVEYLNHDEDEYSYRLVISDDLSTKQMETLVMHDAMYVLGTNGMQGSFIVLVMN
jgi:hypothetical protein